jgi:hypothetical protein
LLEIKKKDMQRNYVVRDFMEIKEGDEEEV